MTIEKLLGIEAPPRAQHVRLMLSEFMRIADHLVCIGTNLVDMGALTNFWYLFQPREEMYGLIEECCGARLLPSYTRIGGLAFDVRKSNPYIGYDTYDFDVPIAEGGDTYARFLVRFEEMRQSLRILQQAIDRGLPSGPVMVDNPYIALPPKEKVYNEMESLIYHFKLIMHGIQPPVGETYFPVEGGNGELGFYIVSDGTKNPYRVRCRPPCFAIFQAYG